ncbi:MULTISPECIES: (d)CMP kinase [Deefgea]|uniref:Cytidylate kinase n=1 Tax=Deefgea chitinilytica TaxID=570276 RepID=A0ABS2C960_9NEIS|nr:MULTISPECIES: (d)CMP kinase [Deefgea]MBM5570691.1 (d)CMP kinase [Deefgea chitinilytica]MBM9887920.1 (d)CMP kinase [Deefgea sp. CFH1-16]
MNQDLVIAIDGPSASGKGTVAQLVAERLGFAYLDSGALYRLTALAALQQGVAWTDEVAVAQVATELDVAFVGERILLASADVALAIRAEEIGSGASQVAALPMVRAALLQRQREFLTAQGLVADGRDMGSVVFPSAKLKVFLSASAQVRAERRYKQLIGRGEEADLALITADLQSRDDRDRQRAVAPLAQSADAFLLETSNMNVETAVAQILDWWQLKR